jgi:hypothetical protein
MKKNVLLAAAMVMINMLCGCSLIGPMELEDEIAPKLTTDKWSEIRVYYEEATLYGTIRDFNSVNEVGFYYGTDQSNLDCWVTGKMVDGKVTADVAGLTPGKRYWYCAAARTRRNTYRANNEESFITFPKGPIDMNLPSGLKWSDKNIGAEYPTDYGEYYAWGETEKKNYYDWTQYKFWNGDNNVNLSAMTKYARDGKKVLDDEDDVAKVKMGGNWRMPDSSEIVELFQYCDIKEVTINDVRGIRLLSKKTMDEENFLFLPFAGYMTDGVTRDCGYNVYFWSRTTYPDGSYSTPHAYSGYYTFTSGVGYGDRCCGDTVRAVCE